MNDSDGMSCNLNITNYFVCNRSVGFSKDIVLKEMYFTENKKGYYVIPLLCEAFGLWLGSSLCYVRHSAYDSGHPSVMWGIRLMGSVIPQYIIFWAKDGLRNVTAQMVFGIVSAVTIPKTIRGTESDILWISDILWYRTYCDIGHTVISDIHNRTYCDIGHT